MSRRSISSGLLRFIWVAASLALLAIVYPGAAQRSVAATAPGAAAASPAFRDGFTSANWMTEKTAKLYQVAATASVVRFSTPGGGAGGFQWVGLQFRHQIRGNFDISIQYSKASIKRVNGSPANQVQLNAVFGGQIFCVVRDDDVVAGNNYHIYTGGWHGTVKTSATSGVLRIVRVGSTVSGYADDTRLYQGTYNSSPVTQLWFSLQNNGTVDPISVTFSKFVLSAGTISQALGVPLLK